MSSSALFQLIKVKHGDYKELPPYWIMINLMEFGTMLRLYRGASPEIRITFAARLGVTARVLKSWLITLNTTRNICVHNARLENKGIGMRLTIPN